MSLANISTLGWLHALACLIALPLGFAQLFGAKGTARHVLIGHCYLIAMVLGSTSSLALPSTFPVRVMSFDIFHWEAVSILVALLMGYIAASRSWASPWAFLHPSAMVYSYYMLIGALLNELFVRIDTLRELALTGTPGATLSRTRLLGFSQSIVMLLFLAIWIYFLAGVRKSRYGRKGGGLRQPSVP